jgi:hypothetical protein
MSAKPPGTACGMGSKMIAIIVVGALIVVGAVVLFVLDRRRPRWRLVMADRAVRAIGRLQRGRAAGIEDGRNR